MKTTYIKHQKLDLNAIKSDNYQDYTRKLVQQKKDFSIRATKYSKIIQVDGKKLIFNEEGRQDKVVLKLINMVRNDVKAYLKDNDIHKYKSGDVDWYYYNDFYGKLKPKGDILKIDLTSAYWTHAVNIGLISDKTSTYFDSIDMPKKEKKYLRLKALGSLATVKHTADYIDGLEVKTEEVYDVDNRNVYLMVCDYVAKTLKEVTVLYGIYSYWDCIFIQDDDGSDFKLRQIETFFHDKGFKFTVEKDSYEIDRSRHNPHLKTTKVDYYPIKINDIMY